MPKVADEELNGAANALLGLHARDSRRSLPSSQPNPEQQPRSRQHRWSSSHKDVKNTVSPSSSASQSAPRAQEVPVPAPGAPVAEHQGPPANPYPFYPKPPAAAATTPYVVEHQHDRGYYANPPVVSTRQDFLGAPGRGGGGGGGGWAQPTAAVAGPATTPPRRRTEWTPRFGPPMTADPRAVMAVRHAPAVDAWTFLQHRHQQQRRIRAHRSPSPAHRAGPPDARHMVYREYPQNVAGGVEAHHPAARVPYHDYAHAAACAGTTTSHLPQYEYATQQHTPYRYQQHQQQQQQPEPEQPHERYEQQPATTAVAVPRPEPLQEQPQPQQPPQPQPPQPQQQQQPQEQQPPQDDVQQRQNQSQQREPSINNLWSLIPGTLERQGSSRLGDHNATSAAGGSGARPHSQQLLSRGTSSCNSDRWFAPDVHLPLSDIARRHRARALARLRARRRALAEAALIPGRPAPVKRHSSETTNEADSGSDEDDDGHRSKVFVVEDKGGMARVVSGGLTRGVSGGVVRAVSGGSAIGDAAAVGGGTEQADGAAAANVVLDGNADEGDKEGVSPAAGGDGKAETAAARATPVTAGDNPPAAATTSSCAQSTASAPHAANASGGSKAGDGNDNGNGNGSTSSKVGDLFELMRNVTMSVCTKGGGDSADGEENLARELGKPVKYRYRQEAARSRKRTRGRFVSEKAPAFVSITELMALRRAERERQQKEEATPVPVGAG